MQVTCLGASVSLKAETPEERKMLAKVIEKSQGKIFRLNVLMFSDHKDPPLIDFEAVDETPPRAAR
jgi:hypothetical protein